MKKNFYAGPSYLHNAVWQRFLELIKKRDGISLLEISHRSPTVRGLFDETENLLRRLASIPESHDILFLQGGASMQFGMVPYNFLVPHRSAYYIDTGRWSEKALVEAKKIGRANYLASSKAQDYNTIPAIPPIPSDAAYVHITSNNTVRGTQFPVLPKGPTRWVADLSSDILSKPMNFSQLDLAYAGLQKNIGTAGASVVIIKRDWFDEQRPNLLSMMSYKVHADARSMFNTPPVIAVVFALAALRFIEEKGGLEAVAKANERKAALLYETIDKHELFHCPIEPAFRSKMNVVFDAVDQETEERFLTTCEQQGFLGLKGHRSRGGLRASIYNAMPYETVEALAYLIQSFT